MLESKKRLGDMLVEAGVINDMQRGAALGEQKRWGGKLASLLIFMGFADERTVAAVLEKQLGQKCIALKDKEIPSNILSMVRPSIAKKYNIVPIDFDKRTLSVAISNPNDLRALDDLTFALGIKVKPVLALEYGIKNALGRYYA